VTRPAAGRSRLLPLALVALIVASLGVAVGVGSAQNAQLSVSNVTVSPAQPAPGQRVTITTTISNAQSSAEAATVTDVYLRTAGSSQDLARVEDLGTVPVGGSIQVPLSVAFPSEGVKNLRLYVVAQSASGGVVTLQYPVSVIVRRGGPQVSLDVGSAVVGVDTPINVTVANGESAAVSQLELTVGGPNVSIDEPRRIAARLEAGQDRNFAFVGRFGAGGAQPITATLQYVTADGERRTASDRLVVSVDQLRRDVAVSASLANEGSVDPGVAVTVSNFGNAPLTDASVRLADGGRTVARHLVGDVPAQSTRTVVVNVSGQNDTTLDVTASYTLGDVAGEASTTVRYTSNPGRIELTGIDASREGRLVKISGSASNVGLGSVDSVVLSVQSGPGVTPAPPNREYFVGRVQASDFVSFDLTAYANADVTSVPVEVTYLSGGVQRTERVDVPIDQPPATNAGPGQPLHVGLWPAVIGGALVVLVVAVIIFVGWRNRGGE